MRSVEMARAICRKDGQHSLLLGSSKRVCQFTRDNHMKIAAALSLSPHNNKEMFFDQCRP